MSVQTKNFQNSQLAKSKARGIYVYFINSFYHLLIDQNMSLIKASKNTAQYKPHNLRKNGAKLSKKTKFCSPGVIVCIKHDKLNQASLHYNVTMHYVTTRYIVIKFFPRTIY